LEVHPSHSPLSRAVAHIRLQRQKVNSMLSELSRAPCTKKSSPLVFPRIRIDHPDASDRSLSKLHAFCTSKNIGQRRNSRHATYQEKMGRHMTRVAPGAKADGPIHFTDELEE
jgi:hypothetical protein